MQKEFRFYVKLYFESPIALFKSIIQVSPLTWFQ